MKIFKTIKASTEEELNLLIDTYSDQDWKIYDDPYEKSDKKFTITYQTKLTKTVNVLNLTSTKVSRMLIQMPNLIQPSATTVKKLESYRQPTFYNAKAIAKLAKNYNAVLLGRYKTYFTVMIEKKLPEETQALYRWDY